MSILVSTLALHEEEYRGYVLVVSTHGGAANMRVFKNGTLSHFDSTYDLGIGIHLAKEWIDHEISIQQRTLKRVIKEIEERKSLT